MDKVKFEIYLIVSTTFLILSIIALAVFVDIRNELRKIRKQVEKEVPTEIKQEPAQGIKWRSSERNN